MLATYALLLALAGAPVSLHDRLDAMRQQVRQNPDLEDEQRTLLESRLAEVDSALKRFEQAVAKEEEATHFAPPFVIAGTALVADDVTGVGAADDVLVPIVALAAVIDGLRNRGPPALELQASMGRLDAAIGAAVQAGQAVLMSQAAGNQIRGEMETLAESLARLVGHDVAGFPGNHQGGDPKENHSHWWNEVRTALKNINKHRLSPKQLLRELLKNKRFTPQRLAEIRQALREACKMMNEEPPDFPPPALP